jgi:hypothetical protein
VVSTNTQRPDVSNITQFYIRYSYKVQTALRTTRKRRSIHDEHTDVHTERNAEQHNAAANRPRRAAWPGALRPPGERLLCMIVLRCDRADAKT